MKVTPTPKGSGARLVRQRAAERLHRLGPRPVLEALIEVADGADLDALLVRYARLPPAAVRAFGGDRFPAPAVFAVRGAS